MDKDSQKSNNRKQPTEQELRFNQASNSIISKRLLPILLSLGILYTLFTIYYYLSLTERARQITVIGAAITAVIMYLMAYHIRKRPANLAAVHPIALFGSVLVLMNAMVHLMLTGQAWQSYIIILLVLGSGLLFFSTNALILLIILSGYCWLAIAWNKLSSPIWIYHGLSLLVFSFISILFHIVRKKNLENTVSLSLREELYRSKTDNVSSDNDSQEQDFSNLFDSTNHLLLSVDNQGRFLFVNRRWEEVLGYNDKELSKINLKQTLDGEHLAKWNDIIQLIARDRTVQKVETTFITKDGQKILVEGNLAGQFRDEKLIAVKGIFRDITIKKKTEDALARERLLLRTVIDNIPEAIYAKDTEMRKILVNKTDLSNIGKAEAEVLGKTDREVFPPEIAESFMEDDRAVLKDGKPVINREELLVNEAGHKMWLLTSKLPLYDHYGKITGLVGIGTNITELKNAKEQLLDMQTELKELNKKLSLAYEEVRNQKDNLLNILQQEELIFVFNTQGVIYGVTEQTVRVTGLTRLELIGSKFSERLESESGAEFLKILKDVTLGAFKTLKIKLKQLTGESAEFLMGLSRLNMEKDRLLIAILRKI